jgi:hypothetical protein
VRATQRILQQLDGTLDFMHEQRRGALLRAVRALIVGGALWLSALGRSCDDAIAAKHSIKAIDRLLGNAALYAQRHQIYAALASTLLRGRRQAVVLVDATEIRPGVCALTASLAMEGRSIPLYAQVRSKRSIGKRASISGFLRGLQRVLPHDVAPILVTDAGFESPWFDQVVELGWDYVGRVRHQTKFEIDDAHWVSAKALHRCAGYHARDLGQLRFPRHRPRARRLVISALPKHQRRTRRNTRGRKGRSANDRRCAKSAREPWLLCTSLQCRSRIIVDIYAQRMQIEQNYRDTKNHRWGWRLDQSRSRSNARLEILMLIAAIAMFVVLALGCFAERNALHKRFQANTLYRRRVLSFFTLGIFVLRDRHLAFTPAPHELLAEIRRRLYALPLAA